MDTKIGSITAASTAYAGTPEASPTETAKVAVQASALMSPMLMPSVDGIYAVGAVAVKIAANKVAQGASKISLSGMGSSWGFWAVALVLPALASLTTGCEPTEIVEAGNSTAVIDSPADVTNSNAVCNPFGDSHPGTDINHGLVGSIAYLSPDQPLYSRVDDYVNFAHPVDVTLFFDKLDIPTRSFDRGFVTQGGTVLKNQQGNTLYEYFFMTFQSVIKLGPNNSPGYYQLALLSDDGSLLQVDTGTGLRTMVNNDGTHPTQFACASQPVYLDSASALPMRLYYYQGPRYHIALTMMWRPWNGSASDAECGRNGNSRYFDWTVDPSAPTSTFNGMLSRGWRVMTADNFHLPPNVAENPCHAQNVPVTTTVTAITPNADYTSSNSAVFEFVSNYPDATFICQLDDGLPLNCISGVTYMNVPDGLHTFKVQAVDPSGNVDPVGFTHSWTVDTIAPTASSIQFTATQTSLNFTWLTQEPASTALSWWPAANPNSITHVPSDGIYQLSHAVTVNGLTKFTSYYFQVEGTDQAGNPVVAVVNPARTKF